MLLLATEQKAVTGYNCVDNKASTLYLMELAMEHYKKTQFTTWSALQPPNGCMLRHANQLFFVERSVHLGGYPHFSSEVPTHNGGNSWVLAGV